MSVSGTGLGLESVGWREGIGMDEWRDGRNIGEKTKNPFPGVSAWARSARGPNPERDFIFLERVTRLELATFSLGS